jgi:hypothetical protein
MWWISLLSYPPGSLFRIYLCICLNRVLHEFRKALPIRPAYQLLFHLLNSPGLCRISQWWQDCYNCGEPNVRWTLNNVIIETPSYSLVKFLADHLLNYVFILYSRLLAKMEQGFNPASPRDQTLVGSWELQSEGEDSIGSSQGDLSLSSHGESQESCWTFSSGIHSHTDAAQQGRWKYEIDKVRNLIWSAPNVLKEFPFLTVVFFSHSISPVHFVSFVSLASTFCFISLAIRSVSVSFSLFISFSVLVVSHCHVCTRFASSFALAVSSRRSCPNALVWKPSG